MALGDENKKKYYEPLVYSPYGTSNTDGVDPSALSYQFYNGLLKISISPMLPNAKPGDRKLWDSDNQISVWLTQAKAKMFHDDILYLLDHIDECNNVGVASGAEGLISFSNGKELGVATPCLIIRKIDQNGNVIAVYAYQFKTDYYTTIRNFKPDDPSNYDKPTHPNLEIENLLTILDDYSKYISGACAYGVMNGMKYDIHKMNTKFSLIMDKLGIESPEYYNGRSSNVSYFSSSNQQPKNSVPSNFMPSPTPMQNTSMEDLEGGME